MYVDSVTIAALVDEFKERIEGGRVQSVVEVDELSIGFEVYANRERQYLLISAHPRMARCHLVSHKLRRGVLHPSPIGLLLKKFVDGAQLTAVGQPPWERIITFDFSSAEGETRLIAEIMDKRSNIILSTEGDILDCIKRVGPKQNRYRVVLPGKTYTPPPPQNKALPEQITSLMVEDFLEADPELPAWRALVNHVAGVSPLFAREVVYRACGDQAALSFDVAGKLVHQEFAALVNDVQAGRWSPCLAPAELNNGKPAFAAYSLTHLENGVPVDNISVALELYFEQVSNQGEHTGEYAAAKAQVKKDLDGAVRRTRRKLQALERESKNEADIELLRKKGELVFAYATTVQPGQTELRQQYDPDGPIMTIKLDPTLTPTQNAQRYFDRYEKAKRAAQDVPKRLKATGYDLAYLEQLTTDLAIAENWPDIDIVREALQQTEYYQGPKRRGPKGGKPGIRRFTTEDEFVILVGRNAAQNHKLVTERSDKSDLWLHARNIPGSHVIIKNDGRPIPDAAIQRAAELAAYYSAGRDDTSVDVDVTERRYVRPIKGAGPGMVTYKNEYTLTVKPARK